MTVDYNHRAVDFGWPDSHCPKCGHRWGWHHGKFGCEIPLNSDGEPDAKHYSHLCGCREYNANG